MRLIKRITAVSVCIAMIICCGSSAFANISDYDPAHFGSKFSFKASLPKGGVPTTVVLRWKGEKKLEKRIKYYRIVLDKRTGKRVKTVKVSGKTKKLTLKKLKAKEQYEVKIYGYTKKKKILFEDWLWFVTGVCDPDVNYDYDNMTTGDCIRLIIDKSHPYAGYKAKKFIVRKKVKGGKWKDFRTYKAKRNVKLYDTKVKYNKKYSYAVRSYTVKKINGKKRKVYSKWDYITDLAINKESKFTVRTSEVTPSVNAATECVLSLGSSELNGTVLFNFDDGGMKFYDDYEAMDFEPEKYLAEVKAFKIDNGAWKTAEGTVSVPPGSTISFRVAAAEGKSLDLINKELNIVTYIRDCPLLSGPRLLQIYNKKGNLTARTSMYMTA